MKVENTVSKAIEICLRIFGIWPTTSCILLRRLFWIFTLVIEQALQYRYIVKHFYLIEFSELMIIFSITMAYTILLFKLVVFWYKQRTFNKILIMMTIDWEKCSKTNFSMFTTTSNVKLSQRFANMTVILYSTSIILYSTFIILFSYNVFVKAADDGITFNVSTHLLILDMDLPFNVNRRFVYETVITVQFFHLLLSANAVGLLNAFLITLILHISGQIDILRKSLIEIFPKEKKLSPSHFMINRIIKKHQKIITFSQHIEDLYSYISMVLFVSDTLLICCLGFTMVTSIGRPDAFNSIIKTVLFYFLMNSEAFIFCFAGEYLSTKSKSIGDAAYNSTWYELDSRDSRIILLLIMRSQNQLTITIGKIMNLSLEQFSNIIKTSASYLSILLAMY
ncbi:odorant receptor 4-like [Temnothorax americanus]|uniref:odorant receptor 4-like n=1 Tax=Temnothorax americanus TaxID=1964332 RepID=UPI0040688578